MGQAKKQALYVQKFGENLSTFAINRDDLKELAGELPEGVSKVYIEIKVGCPYKLFSAYVEELASLATLFTLEDLLIEKDPEEVTDLLKIRLILSTYVLA